MKSKLNFVVWIDRFDYVAGWNNMLHCLAEKLHSLGENVYTLGIGKKNFKYNLFPVKNFDPAKHTLFDLEENPNTVFDWKYSGLDKNNTVFIHYFRMQLPYLGDVKRVHYACQFERDGCQDNYDEKNSLFFYHMKGFNCNNIPYDGLLRWIDIDENFWYPKAAYPDRNTFLIKKGAIYKPDQTELNEHVNKNLTTLSKYTKISNFQQIDNIAGYIQAYHDNDNTIKKIKRDLWSKSDYFACFDPASFVTVLASLCGAKTIIIPTDFNFYKVNLTPDEYRDLFYPYACPGVAYGFDDIDFMMNTRHLVRKHIKEAKDVYLNDVKNLVKKCYEKF